MSLVSKGIGDTFQKLLLGLPGSALAHPHLHTHTQPPTHTYTYSDTTAHTHAHISTSPHSFTHTHRLSATQVMSILKLEKPVFLLLFQSNLEVVSRGCVL